MKYYLGIDGGGTKTEFVLLNEKLEFVSRIIAGKSNPNDIGIDALVSLLKENINKITPKDVEVLDVSMGLSGIAYSGFQEIVTNELKKINYIGEVYSESDRRISLDAVYQNDDGAIAIVGTGNAIYIRKDNAYIHLSGAGFMYDDTLSGFDIGRLAIKSVIEDLEGRGEQTILTKIIVDKYESIGNVIKTTYVEGKKYVADFAKLVTEYYESDKVCNRILQTVVANFDGYLNKVKQYVPSITLVGGLAKLWVPVFSKFSKATDIDVRVADITPVAGAFVRFGFNPKEISKIIKE